MILGWTRGNFLDATSPEEGEDIIDIGEERAGSRLCEKFKVPPAKVRGSKPEWGMGTLIDEKK